MKMERNKDIEQLRENASAEAFNSLKAFAFNNGGVQPNSCGCKIDQRMIYNYQFFAWYDAEVAK